MAKVTPKTTVEKMRAVLLEIAENATNSPGDRIAAVNELGRLVASFKLRE